MKSLGIIAVAALLLAFNTQAQQSANEPTNRPPRGEHRMRGEIPPDIKSQLTEDQITQLNSATTREAKMQLLKSWGIKPAHRPDGERRSRPEGRVDREQTNGFAQTGVAQ